MLPTLPPQFQSTLKHIFLTLLFRDNAKKVYGNRAFVESLSANHVCRLCRIEKQELKRQIVEDPILLRKVSDYEADLKKCDVSETGLTEYCNME